MGAIPFMFECRLNIGWYSYQDLDYQDLELLSEIYESMYILKYD